MFILTTSVRIFCTLQIERENILIPKNIWFLSLCIISMFTCYTVFLPDVCGVTQKTASHYNQLKYKGAFTLTLLNCIFLNKLFCQLANKPSLNNCFLNRCFLHLVIVLKYSVMKKWLNRTARMSSSFWICLLFYNAINLRHTEVTAKPEACYWSVLQIVKVRPNLILTCNSLWH